MGGYLGNQPANVPLTTSQLGTGIVTTPKIADLAVTTAKIADLAVTTAKIADLKAAASAKAAAARAKKKTGPTPVKIGAPVSYGGKPLFQPLASSIQPFQRRC